MREGRVAGGRVAAVRLERRDGDALDVRADDERRRRGVARAKSDAVLKHPELASDEAVHARAAVHVAPRLARARRLESLLLRLLLLLLRAPFRFAHSSGDDVPERERGHGRAHQKPRAERQRGREDEPVGVPRGEGVAVRVVRIVARIVARIAASRGG